MRREDGQGMSEEKRVHTISDKLMVVVADLNRRRVESKNSLNIIRYLQ